MKVLYVDDIQANCTYFDGLLRTIDPNIYLKTFIHAEDAYEHVKYTNYDLAVIDWMMPIISGPQLIECIRMYGNKMPIYVLSSFEMNADIKLICEQFNCGYLQKPLAAEKLAEIIEKIEPSKDQ